MLTISILIAAILIIALFTVAFVKVPARLK